MADIIVDIYNCIIIKYFTRFSVWSFISELEAVCILKLRGHKSFYDGHTDIMVDIYSCIYYKIGILQDFLYGPLFLLEAVRIFKLTGQKAYHYGHTDRMVDIYSCTVCPGSSDPPEKILNIFASENEVYTIF